ncbi:hypothetical protein [Gordonia zhaorongruii]|uniref:hypothetical protein n=1 Tax=Gordonia zhaorongruii TaxID=2597659 RepID=UPI00105081D0|nr:hypothetical protein [Gordonia zhaorongruii]
MSIAPEPAAESAVVARGIAQRGPWGQVFGPIDLDIPAGGLTILRGPAGSGRTALEMTLAGRMKAKSGELSVFGRTRAKKIFEVAALAGVEDLDAVYSAVRVGDLITEQRRWDSPWYHLVGKARDADLERICRPVFGDLPLPALTDYVEQLSELDGVLLRVALANSRRRPLLVVGSMDQVTSDHNQRILVARLAELGREQTVVTTTVNPPAPGLGQRLVVEVPNLTHAELVHHEGNH